MTWSLYRRLVPADLAHPAAFRRDERGAAAVEFALVCMPFVLLLLLVLQMGIFYMAQSALNTGVARTAEMLRANLMVRPSPTLPQAGALRASVVNKSGGAVRDDADLAVEIVPLTTLAASPVEIGDGADYGAAASVLVLRARSRVMTFVPGFGAFADIRSSAVIRRQEL